MKKSLRRIGINGVLTVTIVFATLLSTYPYVLSRFFPLPELTIMIAIEMLFLIAIVLFAKRHKHLPRPLSYICFFQFAIFVILSIYHQDSFYLMRFALFIIITYFTLYVINNNVGIFEFVHLNNKWITIQAVLGVIGFILIIIGILKPLMVYYSENSYNVNYFFGITTTNSIKEDIPRIAGFFDEPGAMAQWGIYALVLNKISNFYNRKIELLLSICLVVTFSMAYFIQLTIYYLVFYFRSLKKMSIILMVFLGTYFIAQSYIPKDSVIYDMTFKRWETNNGQIETNRDQLSQTARILFLQSPVFGKGYTYLVKNYEGFYDNPYETLATSGVLGTFALYLPFLVILLKYRKQGAWQAVTILSVGYLQRPFHVQYIHYLMMYLLFIICYYNNVSDNRGILPYLTRSK